MGKWLQYAAPPCLSMYLSFASPNSGNIAHVAFAITYALPATLDNATCIILHSLCCIASRTPHINLTAYSHMKQSIWRRRLKAPRYYLCPAIWLVQQRPLDLLYDVIFPETVAKFSKGSANDVRSGVNLHKSSSTFTGAHILIFL